MDGQPVPVCCPEDASSGLILLVDAMAPGLGRVIRRGPGIAPREPRTAPAGGILEESPSRCPGPRRRHGTEGQQLEGEKRQLQADLFGRRAETAPRNDRSDSWMTLKTAPSNPGGSRANNRRTPDPNAAIIPDCRPAKNSVNCLRGDISAPVAAGRCSSAVTPRTPSGSRSKRKPPAG